MGQIENGYIIKDGHPTPRQQATCSWLTGGGATRGVTPEQLTEAGREAAAESFQRETRQDTTGHPSPVAR